MNDVAKMITKYKIRMEILPSSVFVPDSTSATNIYTICLKRGGRKLVVPQADRKRKMPSTTTVLESLIEDSALFTRAGNFETWCTENGCTPDDTVAQREYQQVSWYAAALKHFLGEELFNQAIANWEEKNAPLTCQLPHG